MADTLIINHSRTEVGGDTLYFQVWSGTSVWNGSAFEVYSDLNWLTYDLPLGQRGTSSVYAGTFPGAITTGTYNITIHKQVGGSPAVTDLAAGAGNVDWDGSGFVDTADIITTGNADWKTVEESVIDSAVWTASTRTLTEVDFDVSLDGVDEIKAVTDKLDTALELDGAVYRYTTNALEQGPISDATAANQTSILAAVAALNDLSSSDVSTAVQDAGIDGTVDLQEALTAIYSVLRGKVVRTATSPNLVLDYYQADNSTVALTLTIPTDGSGRTVT